MLFGIFDAFWKLLSICDTQPWLEQDMIRLIAARQWQKGQP